MRRAHPQILHLTGEPPNDLCDLWAHAGLDVTPWVELPPRAVLAAEVLNVLSVRREPRAVRRELSAAKVCAEGCERLLQLRNQRREAGRQKRQMDAQKALKVAPDEAVGLLIESQDVIAMTTCVAIIDETEAADEVEAVADLRNRPIDAAKDGSVLGVGEEQRAKKRHRGGRYSGRHKSRGGRLLLR